MPTALDPVVSAAARTLASKARTRRTNGPAANHAAPTKTKATIPASHNDSTSPNGPRSRVRTRRTNPHAAGPVSQAIFNNTPRHSQSSDAVVVGS